MDDRRFGKQLMQISDVEWQQQQQQFGDIVIAGSTDHQIAILWHQLVPEQRLLSLAQDEYLADVHFRSKAGPRPTVFRLRGAPYPCRLDLIGNFSPDVTRAVPPTDSSVV